VQIVLYFARRDGVAPEALRAALAGGGSLSPQLREVMRFAATVSGGDDAPELRETLGARFGSPALVELSLAIATARFFPPSSAPSVMLNPVSSSASKSDLHDETHEVGRAGGDRRQGDDWQR
jgi:hypothetical protein